MIHSALNNPARSLLKAICFPDNKELRVPAVMWDREQEETVLKDYEKAIKSVLPQHRNWTLKNLDF